MHFIVSNMKTLTSFLQCVDSCQYATEIKRNGDYTDSYIIFNMFLLFWSDFVDFWL